MTGVPGTVGRPEWHWPPAPGRPKEYRPSRLQAFTVPPVALRALAFFLLAFFASAHWAALIEPTPTGRVLLATLIATLGGVLIAVAGRLPRPLALAARIGLVLVMTLLAAMAIGIRFKLLMPAGWGTLNDRVTGGLSVVGSVGQWPYDGPNHWLRLTTVLAAPLTLVAASVLAFWPRAKPARALALILLVALYAVPVAARPFSDAGLRGVGLLGCLVAWLWLPRLRGRDAGAAFGALSVAALAALILTPQLAASQPWIDYHQWSWSLHKEKTITYDWRPSYGPLHWPRKGTTLMLIKSKQPEYWRAEVLDEFDGFGWATPAANANDPAVPDRMLNVHLNPKWIDQATVTVRGLASQLVIGPGAILAVHGLPGEPIYLAHGTYLLNGQLSDGVTYDVTGYTPDPSPKQMRAAPHPTSFYTRYTTIDLPDVHGLLLGELRVPLRGVPGSGDRHAAEAIAGSKYGRMYALARRITAGAATSYDMVRRIGTYLQSHYTYSERVPRRQFPLDAFLFQDKRGYCQQFSGAAALMLRMLGVPTRVATGFAPGTLNNQTGEYVVKDLDAHSWIEVWFQGLGWVPFDPTPALAPAASQAGSFTLSEIASGSRGSAQDRLPRKKLDVLLGVKPKAGAAAPAGRQHHTQWGWIILGTLVGVLALAATLISLLRLRTRRRRPLPPSSGDPEVDHMIRLLARLGIDIPPSTTLLELEGRVERLGGEEAAGYAARLRERRYGPDHGAAPTRGERRRLRHLLASGTRAGPIARMHLAMPVLKRS